MFSIAMHYWCPPGWATGSGVGLGWVGKKVSPARVKSSRSVTELLQLVLPLSLSIPGADG